MEQQSTSKSKRSKSILTSTNTFQLSKNDFLTAPIDHYSFYRRQDNNSSLDENDDTDLEHYRDQIARFEQILTTGTTDGMINDRDSFQKPLFPDNEASDPQTTPQSSNSNPALQSIPLLDDFNSDFQDFEATNIKNKAETVFTTDLDHLEAMRINFAQNLQDSQDSEEESQDDNDMNEKERKLAAIERDILHKNYGKNSKKDDNEGDRKIKFGKYPASQPFVKLSLYSENVKQLEKETNCLEVGHLGHWAVSSCKTNHGVKHLRDLEFDTYWQSEGQQPHLISVRFPVAMHFSFLRFYIDEPSDESYTPERISVRVGTNEHDLKEIVNEDIKELTKLPDATWVYCSLENTKNLDSENQPPQISREPFPDEPETNNPQKSYLKAYFVQLAIISNHQNGRDTHIRQVQIFSPRYRLDKKFRIRCDRSQMVNCLSEGKFAEIDYSQEKENEYFTNYEQFKTVEMTKFGMLR